MAHSVGDIILMICLLKVRCQEAFYVICRKALDPEDQLLFSIPSCSQNSITYNKSAFSLSSSVLVKNRSLPFCLCNHFHAIPLVFQPLLCKR